MDRKADLYFAQQHGEDYAKGDEKALVEFQSKFKNDSEAKEHFKSGLENQTEKLLKLKAS